MIILLSTLVYPTTDDYLHFILKFVLNFRIFILTICLLFSGVLLYFHSYFKHDDKSFRYQIIGISFLAYAWFIPWAVIYYLYNFGLITSETRYLELQIRILIFYLCITLIFFYYFIRMLFKKSLWILLVISLTQIVAFFWGHIIIKPLLPDIGFDSVYHALPIVYIGVSGGFGLLITIIYAIIIQLRKTRDTKKEL